MGAPVECPRSLRLQDAAAAASAGWRSVRITAWSDAASSFSAMGAAPPSTAPGLQHFTLTPCPFFTICYYPLL